MFPVIKARRAYARLTKLPELLFGFFRFIFTLVFTGKNLFRTINSEESLEFKKDVIYRFLNSPHFNWRKFLFLLSSSIIGNIVSPLTSEDRVNVLVVEDELSEE